MQKPMIAATLVAAACVVTVLAQQRDAVPEPTSQRRGPDEPSALPPGLELGSKLEWFLMRPGRVVVRDTWRVGRLECKPWAEGAPGGEGVLRVNAVVAHAHDKPDERMSGLELVVQGEFGDRTFMFDTEQVADLLVALETVRAAAETMRDPPQDVGRRAVYNLNGLELGMAPRRAGGYLAPVGPDEPSVALNPDNFQEMKRVITDAQTILKRETAAK